MKPITPQTSKSHCQVSKSEVSHAPQVFNRRLTWSLCSVFKGILQIFCAVHLSRQIDPECPWHANRKITYNVRDVIRSQNATCVTCCLIPDKHLSPAAPNIKIVRENRYHHSYTYFDLLVCAIVYSCGCNIVYSCALNEQLYQVQRPKEPDRHQGESRRLFTARLWRHGY